MCWSAMCVGEKEKKIAKFQKRVLSLLCFWIAHEPRKEKALQDRSSWIIVYSLPRRAGKTYSDELNFTRIPSFEPSPAIITSADSDYLTRQAGYGRGTLTLRFTAETAELWPTGGSGMYYRYFLFIRTTDMTWFVNTIHTIASLRRQAWHRYHWIRRQKLARHAAGSPTHYKRKIVNDNFFSDQYCSGLDSNGPNCIAS